MLYVLSGKAEPTGRSFLALFVQKPLPNPSSAAVNLLGITRIISVFLSTVVGNAKVTLELVYSVYTFSFAVGFVAPYTLSERHTTFVVLTK